MLTLAHTNFPTMDVEAFLWKYLPYMFFIVMTGIYVACFVCFS